jgi:hypothetical protein
MYKDNSNSHIIKLTNIPNKYMTMIDGEPKMRNKIFSNNQSVSYNTQGELIIDDQCLTQKSGKVYFDKCKNEKKQLWKIDNNKIYSLNSPEMCLSTLGENVTIKQCSNNENENENEDDNKWIIEESDIEKTSDYKPIKYKGKTIVLVDSENPWYLNYDTTIPIEYSKKQDITQKQYRNDSDYGSDENLEFEHFNNNNKNNNINIKEENKISENKESTSQNQNQIIFLLLIIVVILIVYKHLQKTTK